MSEHDEEFLRRIRRQAEHVGRGRKSSIWRDLGSLGALGWMIAAPSVVGAFVGRRIDHWAETGVFWTLSLLMVGLFAGCASAWRQARREIEP